jgi:hypothetical protein
MLIRINKDLEYKLNYISKTKSVKKTDLIDNLFKAFIKRYETKFNKIIPEKREKKETGTWTMYELFKKHYFEIYSAEYERPESQLKIDLAALKKTKAKIVDVVVKSQSENIIAIDEEDLINSFEHILIKMPDWWKKNSFTPQSINKNFEKILTQIENGKRNGKDALDDFISKL